MRIGDLAPLFTAQKQDASTFDLQTQKGKWTVLYFYPKADTPGCTKQACAFRDSIAKIRKLGAEVYGISTDTVSAQAAFHKKHHLTFDLLADPKGEVTTKFGAKMPLVNISKRWTFVIGPDLKLRHIEKDVDPAVDSEKVAKIISDLQAEAASSSAR